MHENTLRRIAAVQAIVAQHYEKGRRDRCYREVWRRYVYPVYPISYATFKNYMSVDIVGASKRMTRAKNAVSVHYERLLFD
ncbi:hypothetical protein [Porphyromonas crevioricanis]|uniref:Uncharacterized protein n=1 Tax=Porphyromonas crevioricanis TaxID=393921 RepID=A0A2X4SIE8_9PORP|nr:hypothetical protein [Porphyromonas crevioricanis]GAD07592.1 hypothetical protein PORCAN_1214 [Porphyromonas crevioricanis JCM 13913]SQH73702.1 Uncharacterised protein [Porphyromonas crevioricanis]